MKKIRLLLPLLIILSGCLVKKKELGWVYNTRKNDSNKLDKTPTNDKKIVHFMLKQIKPLEEELRDVREGKKTISCREYQALKLSYESLVWLNTWVKDKSRMQMMMGIYSLDSTDSLYVSHYVLAEAVKKWDLHNDDHVRVYDNYRKSDSMYHTGINYNYDLTKNFSDIDYSAFPKVSIEWDSIFNQSDSGIVYPVRRIDFLQKRKEDTPDSFWVRYRIYVYSSDYNHERYVPPSTSRALGFAISHEYHGLEFESFELWSWYSERIDCPHALKQISDSASYTLKSDTAHILISDFEIIDGDSVNVYLDNILVKENIALQKDPMIITISMQGKKTRELLFEALSEGTKSPCTIGVLIQETGQKFKLNSKKHHFMKVTLSR